MSKSIETIFAKAGLKAEVVDDARQVSRAFRGVANAGDAFLMDIRRDRKGERFVIRPGTAQVEVVNFDKELQQAILFVHEKEREFSFRRWDPRQLKNVLEVRKTPAQKRHFLMGMDECHLFVCPLPKAAATVAAAHKILAPESVQRSRERKGKVVRQGEWFFTPVTSRDVLTQINDHIRKMGVQQKARIGPRNRRGRAHVADEIIRMPTRVKLSSRERESQINRFKAMIEQQTFVPARSRGIRMPGTGAIVRKESDLPDFRTEEVEYVRGSIKHPDHHAIHLRGWHAVSVNTEKVEEPIAAGMTWID